MAAADDCVVLFYRGQRYWVGPVTAAADADRLGHVLTLLLTRLEAGDKNPADSLMAGVEK